MRALRGEKWVRRGSSRDFNRRCTEVRSVIWILEKGCKVLYPKTNCGGDNFPSPVADAMMSGIM